MLYVDDSDGHNWLEIVAALSEREPLDLVLRLYAGSATDEFPAPFVAPVVPEPLEEVSEFSDQWNLPCSARTRVTSELVSSLREHVGEFEDWGDTLSLYPANDRRWAAAYFPHARTVLIRDVALHGFLEAAGIPVCFEPTDNW